MVQTGFSFPQPVCNNRPCGVTNPPVRTTLKGHPDVRDFTKAGQTFGENVRPRLLPHHSILLSTSEGWSPQHSLIKFCTLLSIPGGFSEASTHDIQSTSWSPLQGHPGVMKGASLMHTPALHLG